MPTEEDQILERALAPKKASGDSGSMEQHSVADMIAALKLKRAAESAAATGTGLYGIKRTKMIPGNSD
jgi:hypothetical protein